MVACGVLLQALISIAVAQQTGLVARVEGEGIVAPVMVRLDGEEGSFDVTLNDQGDPPDVLPDDDRWAGDGILKGDTFLVTLTMGETQHVIGEVSWTSEGTPQPRDLILSVQGGMVTAEARTARTTVTRSPETGAREPVVTLPGSAQPDSYDFTWIIGLGVGLLLLAGAAFVWRRWRGSQGYAVKTNADLMPEPPLFGTGTPSVSQGTSVWKLAEGERSPFIAALVTRLARHHRVLVVGADAPPVERGPVYVADSDKPVHVGDAAEDLLAGPGLPLVVVLAKDEVNTYEKQLPESVGVLFVTTALPQETDATCLEVTQSEEGWSISSGETTVRLDPALEPKLGAIA